MVHIYVSLLNDEFEEIIKNELNNEFVNRVMNI
jgi:hypothetical protein